MPILIYLFIGTGVTLILQGIFSQPSSVAVASRLPKERELTKRLRIPVTIASFIQKLLEKFKIEEKIKDKLAASHLKLSPIEFFCLKMFLMLGLATLNFFILRKLEPVVLLVAVALGYILPDIYLMGKINKRKYMISRILPETVDLLGLCVEAGLDFTSALRWIIEKVPFNPMIEELTLLLEEIKWGKSRVQALKDMSKRLNIPGVRLFVQTLVQAERMGTAIGETFAILSEDMRLERFRRGERIAMQAPIKILIPLIFCILPVIGIIIGGPIFLQFMQGGLLKGIGG